MTGEDDVVEVRNGRIYKPGPAIPKGAKPYDGNAAAVVAEHKAKAGKMAEDLIAQDDARYNSARKPLEGQTAQLVLKYVNEERRKVGVAPLSWDGTLSSMAKDMSEDMARYNHIGHVSYNGDDVSKRAAKFGLPGNVRENTGTVGMVEVDSESVARNIVHGYMDSPPHRAQMLSSKNARFGAGVTNKGKSVYNAQEFR
jgi:uncharacterized protein YkwD